MSISLDPQSKAVSKTQDCVHIHRQRHWEMVAKAITQACLASHWNIAIEPIFLNTELLSAGYS